MKRALIFGASGDIGQEIAKEMAQSGWSLILHFAHHEEIVQNLAQNLASNFPEQEFVTKRLDFLSDKLDFSDINNLDAVIFAQGITDYKFLKEQTDQSIDDILKINLVQPLKIVKALESKLQENNHSRIIFIGSVYDRAGSALESVYSATKGGLKSFANAYAKEVAPKTTVNIVSPGAVKTKMNQEFSAAEIDELVEEIPMSRMATPADVAFWVLNLLDEKADYITGQTIYVNGGWLV